MKTTGDIEFIILMALLMANVALSIDAVLPALDIISKAFKTYDGFRSGDIITYMFLGLGIGELFFGIASDFVGRKPAIYLGVSIFVLSSCMCLITEQMTVFLLGRVLQGFGLAALRTVSMAIIRDNYSGNRMAKIMSFVTSIFIIVPMIAPVLGQILLDLFHWQSIIYFQLGFLLVVILWFHFRLKVHFDSDPFEPIIMKRLSHSLKLFFSFRSVYVFTGIAGLVEGAFIFYLSSVKTIITDYFAYNQGFAYIFGLMSLVLGLATFWNGRMVLKVGMLRLLRLSVISFNVIALTGLLYLVFQPSPNVFIYLVFLAILFVPLGILFGNITALALEPLGAIAGFAASLYNCLSMLIGFTFAWFIGQLTLEPYLTLFLSFLLVSVSVLILIVLSGTKLKTI